MTSCHGSTFGHPDQQNLPVLIRNFLALLVEMTVAIMICYNKMIIIISLILFSVVYPALTIYTMPYQLINNESALIIPHMNFEVKEDVIYSMGYIDDWGIKTQLRWGLGGFFEISCAASFNYFPDVKGPEDLYLDYYNKRGNRTRLMVSEQSFCKYKKGRRD